jgi:glutamate 5-kinase
MKIWVIKAGSALLQRGGKKQVEVWMRQVQALEKMKKIQIVWVTSGAIARGRTMIKKKNPSLQEKQALSALGQPNILQFYHEAQKKLKSNAAQVLLTLDDLKSKDRSKNLVNTIKTLLSWGVLPVLNENDAVATDEIRFGDNDILSARLAVALKAEKLILLSEVDGFYEEDPKFKPSAKKLSITKDYFKISRLKGHTNFWGSGGIESKAKAFAIVQKKKIHFELLKQDLSFLLNS